MIGWIGFFIGLIVVPALIYKAAEMDDEVNQRPWLWAMVALAAWGIMWWLGLSPWMGAAAALLAALGLMTAWKMRPRS